MSLLHYHSQPALRISTVGALGVNGGVAGPAVVFAGKDAALSFAEGRRYVRIWPLGEDMKISLSRPLSLLVTYTSVPTHDPHRQHEPGGALIAIMVCVGSALFGFSQDEINSSVVRTQSGFE